MSNKPRVLLIDDDQAIITSLEMKMSKEVFFFGTSSIESAFSIISKENIQVVLLDIQMPKVDALSILKRIQSEAPDVAVIMHTMQSETLKVVEFIKQGAFSYLLKNEHSKDELLNIIELALKNRELKLENDILREATTEKTKDFFIGKNVEVISIYNQAKKIAPAKNINVIIRGETGVGKDYLARYIHANSDRKNKPFVAINCGAIPESLIESELFGHEKGAFTDASVRKIGKFEKSQGGTIFLDEIGTMPIDLQVRLLRVIQEKKIERVGGSNEIDIDVRIIAATNADIEEAIKNKIFREDLFFRLKGLELRLPPLREREEDIEDLVQYFIKKHCLNYGFHLKKISKGLLTLLKIAPWPGNLRELDSFIEVLIYLLKDQNELNVENLPKDLALRFLCDYNKVRFESVTVKKKIVSKVVDAFEGNITAASAFLDMDRSTIYRILK